MIGAYDKFWSLQLFITVRYRGMKMKLSTIRFFTQAIIHGNKYIYQTLPRVLTLWLDMGDKGANESKDKAMTTRATSEISRIYDAVPVYKVNLLYAARSAKFKLVFSGTRPFHNSSRELASPTQMRSELFLRSLYVSSRPIRGRHYGSLRRS